FNDDWEVVALHHSGYAKRNAQSEILAQDGRVWTESMGEDQIDWIANEGVRVAALVKYLGSVAGLDEDKQKLLTRALSPATTANAAAPAPLADLPPEPPTNPVVVAGQEAGAPAEPPPPPRQPPIAPAAPAMAGAVGGGETVITIPLQISV